MLDLAENPRGAYETVISDLPAAMFFTLPLYAAWLKLMYRRRFYSEHLVFALHLHAFLFFIGTFILLLPDTHVAVFIRPRCARCRASVRSRATR